MTVKEAVAKAMTHCSEVFGYDVSDVRLEEVERRGSTWAVTLSFVRPGASAVSSTGKPVVATSRPREFKVFHIEEDGSLDAVKMRTA